MSVKPKLVVGTIEEWNQLVAWINSELGYPEGGTTTFSSNPLQRAIDGKWYLDTIGLPNMTGCPVSYTTENWTANWPPIVEDESPETPVTTSGFAIADYVDPALKYNEFDTPFHINYKTQLKPDKVFYPVYTFGTGAASGDLLDVKYYGNKVGENYANLIIRVEQEYFMESGIYVYRPKFWTWYLKDGTPYPTKKSKPYHYTPQEGMDKVERKRKNIVSQSKIALIGLLCETEQVAPDAATVTAKTFLTTIGLEMSNYIQGSEAGLITALENSQEAWMTNEVASAGNLTIKEILLSKIDYNNA